MQFPGYWVVLKDAGGVSLISATFDETELDPATNWKQAWQNESDEFGAKGYVGLEMALSFSAETLAAQAGHPLRSADLARALQFTPVWTDDRCEIASLSQLIGGAWVPSA
jgi:hypothetical protein